MTAPVKPPADLWSTLDSALPIAMLPIRLETRYCDQRSDEGAAPAGVLRIRMYPDDIAVTEDQSRPSQPEVEAAKQFWGCHADAQKNAADSAAADYQSRRAWEVLTRRVGIDRAFTVAAACRGGFAGQVGDGQIRQRAQLLPDAWVIAGFVGGKPVFTHHQPCSAGDTLAVAPAERPDADTLDPQDPHLIRPDDESRWLTDFSDALRIGMAAEIDLVGLPGQLADGLDTLVVIGVREPGADRDPVGEAGVLTDLLTGHASAGALSLLAQGTPTNNLTDQPSGFNGAPDVFAGYRQLFNASAVPAVGGDVSALQGGSTDGAAIEAALGLAAHALAGVPGADGREQQHARAMAVALFPVTIGEAVAVLSRPAEGEYGMEFDEITAFLDKVDAVMPFALRHFASFVRGRGPLPALRVGRQPYGVLPVLCGDGFVSHGDESKYLGRLKVVLDKLRPYWQRAARQVPNLVAPAGPGESVSDIVGRILTQGPVPHRGAYAGQEFDGLVWNLVDKAASVKTMPVVPVDTVAGYAHRGQFEILEAIRTDVVKSVIAQTVRDETMGFDLDDILLSVMASRSEGDAELLGRAVASTDTTHYLSMLAGAGVPEDLDKRPEDLLYLLIEHALALSKELTVRSSISQIDRALVTADFGSLLGTLGQVEVVPASSLDERKKQFASVTLRDGLTEAGHSQLRNAVTPARMAEIIDRPIVDAVVDFDVLDALRPSHPGVIEVVPKQRVNNYQGTRNAVRTLADAALDIDDLARLTGEVLDCCSSRLDAWYTSLAAQRLDTLRTDRRTGIQLGCWGVLVDVRRRQRGPADVPPNWTHADIADGPLQQPNRQVGYVHAPSLDQARTAGVLRAGELAHRDSGSSVASIDLTSERVRVARELLDGVTNGQPLGAMLGYQLERELGDAGEYAVLSDLRGRYPQRFTPEAAAGSDSVVAACVVDGLAVHEHRADVLQLDAVAGNTEVRAIIDNLARKMEAVSDLLVAEGVHAITTGRSDTAGAVFSAIATGARPPDPAVTHEPRSGVTITHVVALALTSGEPLAGWNHEAVRATLAPHAESWAQSVLGPATDWVIAFSTPGSPDIGLEALGVCALDILAEAGQDSGPTPRLAERLRAAAGLPEDAEPTGDAYDRLLALGQSAADVLGGCRPATAVDLTVRPPVDPEASGVADELPVPTEDDRRTLATALTGVLDALDAAVRLVIAAGQDADEDTTVPAGQMRIFTRLGFAGAHFRSPNVSIDDAVSVAQNAAGMLRDVGALLPSAAQEDGQPATWEQRLDGVCKSLDGKGNKNENGLDVLVDVTRRIGGRAVVPTVAVRHELTESTVPITDIAPEDEAVDQQAEADLRIARWLTRLGRVRSKTAAYEDLRIFMAARNADAPALQVRQLPFVDGEGWLGGSLPAADPPKAGRKPNELRRWKRPTGPRAHVLLAAMPYALTGDTVHALIVDEIAEVLPAPTVTTGLAIHYDAPNARAPQTILLATPADPSRPWTHIALTETVTETVGLGRLRGVTLDDLAPTGAYNYVPLTYVRHGLDNVKPLAPRPNAFVDIAKARAIGVDALRIHTGQP